MRLVDRLRLVGLAGSYFAALSGFAQILARTAGPVPAWARLPLTADALASVALLVLAVAVVRDWR